MKKPLIIIATIIIIFGSLYAQQTENVIIVVIDGARYSETFGDSSHKYIPKIWNQLRQLGTIYTSFYVDGITKTNPAHASILTGTKQTIDNNGGERPRLPTLFEYYRKERSSSLAENYVVLGKDKLDILTYSDHPEYGFNYRASLHASISQYDDGLTYANTIDIIATSHPRLILINFAGTDRAAHDGPWSNYVLKLQNADSLVNELWNYIQTDSVYQDRTTIIITNDHGRHLDEVSIGFRDHGDTCEGCRHVATLIIGPDTPAGLVDTVSRKQIDIAPTVGWFLQFSTPYSIGTLINTAITADIKYTQASFPQDITLFQNFPNPFNPLTKMNFSLQTSQEITLKVYDFAGNEVATLLKGEKKSAGYYEVIFNATNMSSGMYVYRLQAGESVNAKKMLLIK